MLAAVKIRSNEGLTLETPAVENLYGGRFKISTRLMKQLI